ncbi:MAG: UDP-N-acetylglucosamine 2-epimerase [Phycisphaerae bacterium]
MKARQRRRVAVVTGTRAEYGLLCSTMGAIHRHPALELQTVVTGMHLVRKFGYTADKVAADGWHIDTRVPMQTGRDSRADQALGLARGIEGMARFFERAKTDLVVVLGDRIEATAGALAAVTTGRFCAHLHGGDVAIGDVDEGLRHAVTKLAHLHFAATDQSARRIARLGERPDTVFTVGAPGLDRIRELLGGANKVSKSDTPSALVVQHPCGRSVEQERRVMAALLRAVAGAGLSATVIYPNSDPGHTGIIQAIGAGKKKKAGRSLRSVRSLERDEYLRTLAKAHVLVGNSSSGIIEAASAGTPAVNIGSRQQGRQRSGAYVVDSGETCPRIRAAIAKAITLRPKMGAKTCYGQGRTGEKIARILARVRLDETLRRKRITY